MTEREVLEDRMNHFKGGRSGEPAMFGLTTIECGSTNIMLKMVTENPKSSFDIPRIKTKTATKVILVAIKDSRERIASVMLQRTSDSR